MVLCLQVAARSSKEELGKDCGVAWATDYALEDGEYKWEVSTYNKQEPKPCEVWMLVLKLISFSHFFFTAAIYHIPLGSFYFLQCLRSSEISFTAPTLCTSIRLLMPSLPFHAALFAALLPCSFPPVHPSFTLLLPTSHLKVIWHSCGQVRAWQYFEVWVYYAQGGRDEMRAEGQPQAAPGALGRGLTALEIQKLILGQTTVPHEGKQCLHSTGSLWPETGLVPSRIPLCCTYTEGNGRCF